MFPRTGLSVKCNGFDKAIITKNNTPVGSKLVYDGDKKKTLQVNKELFNIFTKVGFFCVFGVFALKTEHVAPDTN